MKEPDIAPPKKRIGNFPNTNVVLSITTALFLIGVFAIFSILANELTKQVRGNIEIQVFLKKKINQDELAYVKGQLSQKEFIDVAQGGQKRIAFVSRDEAAQKLTQETGEDFVKFLGDNPLRDSYVINIKEEFYNKGAMEKLKADVEQIPGVYEVAYVESLIDAINENISKIGTVIAIFVAVMIITVMVLINNAVKLALYSQRFLIRSMQLVGATAMFIKKPFLMRALLQGIVGGLLSCVLLLVLILFANSQIQELEELHNFWKTAVVFLCLVGVGAGICFGSALMAVNRYLSMKLDQLY